MIKIIKNIDVYAPEHIGIRDVVLAGEKIEGIYENLEIPKNFIDIEVIDGRFKKLFPGFIDAHVHLLGGGGEGGYHTRTPEIAFSTLTTAGITTVVGCLGTDGVCRSMKSLVAKVKALKEEGITAYCYTGSYDIPAHTMTDSIKSDLLLVSEIIGVGEVALSDHRSSQPRIDQFINLVAQARGGGLLSGKPGIVNVHLGSGERKLNYLFKLIEETEIPPSQILPTHISRSKNLLEMGLEWIKKGGYIDLTSSSDKKHLEKDEVVASDGLKYLLDNGADIQNITFTSDGNGSMPIFDDDGKLTGLGICSVKTLYEEVKLAIFDKGIEIETALKVITENPSRILKLHNKGKIEAKKDADLVIVDGKTLEIDTVIALGEIMVKNGEIVKYGTFEHLR